MTDPIFVNNNSITVYASGPGTMHLLSYAYDTIDPPFVVGHLDNPGGFSKFLISFSHNYNRFAFYWDGKGAANLIVAQNPTPMPVGGSWAQASFVQWGDTVVSTKDVTSIVPQAIDRGNATTIFIV